MKDNEQIAIQIARLGDFHAMYRDEQFREVLRRLMQDPLKPKTDKGSLRVNPILILQAMTVLLAGATFLVFSFVQL